MVFISAREHSYTVNEDKKCEKKHRSGSIASRISKISPNTGSSAQPNYMCTWVIIQDTFLAACVFFSTSY